MIVFTIVILLLGSSYTFEAGNTIQGIWRRANIAAPYWVIRLAPRSFTVRLITQPWLITFRLGQVRIHCRCCLRRHHFLLFVASRTATSLRPNGLADPRLIIS